MADMTIDEFCDKYGACPEGRKWALENCCSMADAWDKLPPEWLLWVATRPGVLTDRELRLSAVNSARSVRRLLSDPRSLAAIDAAQRFADSEISTSELAAAWEAAWEAAWAAAGSAAWEAAWVAAWAAAWAAARAAAGAAARAAAIAAAGEAGAEASSKWLRENTSPNFEARTA